MKLTAKLLALLVLVGVVPLVAVSLLLIDIGRTQVEETVQQVHRLEAHAAAADVRKYLHDAEQRLVADLEASMDVMVDEDIRKALIWMLNKPENLLTFRVLRVFEVERGLGTQPIGEVVHLPPESIHEDHRSRFLVLPEDVATFDERLPVAAALADAQTRLSPVYFNERRQEALVALAVPITDRVGQVTWVVGGELSLRPLQRLVADVSVGEAGFAYLVDGSGRPVAHPRFDAVSSREPLTGNGIVERALRSQRPAAVAFEGENDVPQLGAHAPVLWGDWQLIVQQPRADAYRAVNEMQQRAGFILAAALIVCVTVGLLFVRTLTTPLKEVMSGMRRIVDGQFRTRLAVRTKDEVGELAGAFNTMGEMLQRFRDEIEGWNQELQARVDAKTRQLESAQAQLIQSSKMSALGHLGAGIAHELNNPLAGIVGQAALLKRRIAKAELSDAEREKLRGYVEHVERESSRCREIIHGLLSFSQATAGGTDVVDVDSALQKLLVLFQNNARSAGVELGQDLDCAGEEIEANEQQLQQVLMHLLTNSLQATPEGGKITVSTSRIDDGVAIRVTDTGRGIAPEHIDKVFDPFFTTKNVWQSTGLGLSVCYSIVESHGGTIEIESEPDRGTTVTVRLSRKSARLSQDSRPEHRGEEEHVGLRRHREPVAAGG